MQIEIILAIYHTVIDIFLRSETKVHTSRGIKDADIQSYFRKRNV